MLTHWALCKLVAQLVHALTQDSLELKLKAASNRNKTKSTYPGQRCFWYIGECWHVAVHRYTLKFQLPCLAELKFFQKFRMCDVEKGQCTRANNYQLTNHCALRVSLPVLNNWLLTTQGCTPNWGFQSNRLDRNKFWTNRVVKGQYNITEKKD